MLRLRDALVWYLLASWAPCPGASAAPPLASAGTKGHPPNSPNSRALKGRFLHITDFHPDPHYKAYSSTAESAACHRKHGPAGYYGAETSACDSPKSLVNATLEWVRDNLADQVDFVIWTGDSARHDNDEKLPRTQKEIIALNEFMVQSLANVFGTDGDPHGDFAVPIVPTFGNNDIMPHNILLAGPNMWTVKFLDIWRAFIPEEQRHQFQQGGWFFVEVIPNKLAVVSLNTMYFFSSNSGVDGCANKHEPGYEHFEWLRIQLQLFRERGMHAILIGHVPPARVDSKESWDETCWQKYTLWVRQYRDVNLASLYGHMNIDHFILHDFNHIKEDTKNGLMSSASVKSQEGEVGLLYDGEVTVASASDYLLDLRRAWGKLPTPPSKKNNKPLSIGEYVDADEDEERSWWRAIYASFLKGGKGDKSKKPKSDKQKYLHKIGGKYAERYSVNLVSPSVVPNYFPTIRVIEYNITGLENMVIPPVHQPKKLRKPLVQTPLADSDLTDDEDYVRYAHAVLKKKHKKKEKDALKKNRQYKFKVPLPPPKGSLPGPAYRPQQLTLTGYTQYYANLTHINNDFVEPSTDNATHAVFGLDINNDGVVEAGKWKEGKHHKHQGKKPRPEPRPKKFEFEVEYDTRTDKAYKLKDLTVRSYVDLAKRIARVPDKKKKKKSLVAAEGDDFECDDDHDDSGSDSDEDSDVEADIKKQKGKKHKHKKKKHIKNPTWFAFVHRAFVSTMSTAEIEQVFGVRDQDPPVVAAPADADMEEL